MLCLPLRVPLNHTRESELAKEARAKWLSIRYSHNSELPPAKQILPFVRRVVACMVRVHRTTRSLRMKEIK